MATARKMAAKKAASKKTASKKTATKRPTSARKSAPRKALARRGRPDATTVLEKQHRDVKGLFRRYERLAKADADAAQRQELAGRICDMLTMHATIEEEIFYPAVREAGVEADILDEAAVEHASAKDLVGQIQASSPDDELYDAKVKVLGEYVNHHVQEEEGAMFGKARRAKMDLEGLGERLRARAEELLAGGSDGSAGA